MALGKDFGRNLKKFIDNGEELGDGREDVDGLLAAEKGGQGGEMRERARYDR